MRHSLRLGLLLLLASCHRDTRSRGADALEGQVLPLLSGTTAAFRVAGTLDGHPAEVVLDVSAPLSTVAASCFPKGRQPASEGEVQFPTPSGAWRKLPEVRLMGLRLGERALGERTFAVVQAGGTCLVTLGSDVLGKLALSLDLVRRELRFERSRDAEHYREASPLPGEERHVLSLTRAPSTDWLLIATRAEQGEATFTGTLVFSTGEPQSVISERAAKQAKLRPGPDLIESMGLPPALKLPEGLVLNSIPVDSVALSPEVQLRHLELNLHSDWKNQAIDGVLGADVWGRFHVTVDAQAQTLVLRRPLVKGEGNRQLCAQSVEGKKAETPVAMSEEACFQFQVRKSADGAAEFLATLWQPLPDGGMLHLEPLDAQGQPLRTPCQVGFSFGPSDRGAIAAQKLPSESLSQALPECAQVLKSAVGARIGMFEDGSADTCPSNCGFVRDMLTERSTCECPPRSFGARDSAEQRLLELYRQLMEQLKRSRGNSPDEPPSPEEEPQDDL